MGSLQSHKTASVRALRPARGTPTLPGETGTPPHDPPITARDGETEDERGRGARSASPGRNGSELQVRGKRASGPLRLHSRLLDRPPHPPAHKSKPHFDLGKAPSPARPKARPHRRLRVGALARHHARALTCGRRCRGCGSHACLVCSSRRRSSVAASGDGAGTGLAGGREDCLHAPAAAPARGPEPVAPAAEPGPARPHSSYSLPSAVLTVWPLLRRQSLAMGGPMRKLVA